MKSSAVEYRAAKIALATGLSTALSIALQIVSVPICLHYWGQEIYGVWLSLFAAFLVLRTADVGYVNYVGNKINLLYHQDTAALRETLASAMWGAGFLGVLQLAVSVFVVATAGVSGLLEVPDEVPGKHETGLALLVLVVSWVLSGPYLGIVHRLLVPAGMMYEATWWAMGYQACQFAAIITAAVLQATILQVSIAFAFSQAFIYLASAVYIRHKLPNYYPWWRGPQLNVAIRDLARSTPFTLASVFQQASNSGLVLVVAAISGPTAVPVITTVRTMANLWTNLSNVLTAPLLPEVVRYHANREGEKLIAVNQAHWLFAGTIINLSILFCIPFVERVYAYWTAKTLALDKPLLCYLLASIVLVNGGALMGLYLNGINNLKSQLATSVVRGCFVLGLSIILLPNLGSMGLGIAILSAEVLTLVVLGNYFMREVARFDVKAFISALWPTLASAGFVLAYLYVESIDSSWSSLAYFAAVAGVTFAAVRGWHGIAPEVKRRVVRLVNWRHFSG